METLLDEWPRLLLMLGILAASALFAGAETAFFTLTRENVRHLRDRGGILPALVVRLRSSPRPLLISVLLGNLAVNVAFFSESVRLSEIVGRAGDTAVEYAIYPASVALIILFGEYLPKGFALSHPVSTAERVSVPVFLFAQLIFPLRFVLDHLVGFVTRPLDRGRTGRAVTAEELKAFVRLTGESGRLEAEEREMLEDVIDLGEIRVKEVMVPRVDMVAIDITEGKEALVELARQRRVSKVIVYEEGSRDRVLGYVALKDLLYRPGAELREVLREIRAVPEAKTAESLLKDFRAEGRALALVVDEYGGTAGIVTPEDVLEEVVGEISDEYDEESGGALRMAPGVHLVPGHMTLREWDEYAGSPLPPGKYETVGGFVTATLDRIPKPGDSVRASGYRLTVLRVRRGRILSLVADRLGEVRP